MSAGSRAGERRLAERVGFEPTVEFPLHTLSKRAPSTTRTSLRFRINELRTVLNSVAQNPPSNPARPQIDLSSATCGHASSDCVRNCVRPLNEPRSLTDICKSWGITKLPHSFAGQVPRLRVGLRRSFTDDSLGSGGGVRRRERGRTGVLRAWWRVAGPGELLRARWDRRPQCYNGQRAGRCVRRAGPRPIRAMERSFPACRTYRTRNRPWSPRAEPRPADWSAPLP